MEKQEPDAVKKDEGSDSEHEPVQGEEADLRDVRYILEKLGIYSCCLNVCYFN